METNSIVKSFMMEKILKIDFQNFYISPNVSKSISWTFLASLHNETIVKYAFHEIVWKKYFTVYPRFFCKGFDGLVLSINVIETSSRRLLCPSWEKCSKRCCCIHVPCSWYVRPLFLQLLHLYLNSLIVCPTYCFKKPLHVRR